MRVHRLLLLVVAIFSVALGSLGVAVGMMGGTGHCPVAAESQTFGTSHQEARDRARTPGNELASLR
jgi:hypothetical protein